MGKSLHHPSFALLKKKPYLASENVIPGPGGLSHSGRGGGPLGSAGGGPLMGGGGPLII